MNKNLKRLGIGGLLMIVISGGVWYFGDKQRTMNVAEKIELAGVQARIFNKITYKIGEIREMIKKPKELMIFNSREGAVKEDEELIKVFKDNKNVLNSEKVDISNWKTYRNDHYGYVISYPKDWMIFAEDYSDEKYGTRAVSMYITKGCVDKKRGCENEVHISVFIPTSFPPEKKTTGGKLDITLKEAFHDIFTLKEGENRKSLEYNKQATHFVYDGIVHGSYNFIVDPIYYDSEITYRIAIRETTQDRKYLKIEEAILNSLHIIKKTK